MKPTWIIEDYLLDDLHKKRLREALEAKKIPYKVVMVVPFSSGLPTIEGQPIKVEGPIVAYGTTTLIKNIKSHNTWTPGCWFERENFRTSTWQKKYGANILNADAEILPLYDVDSYLRTGGKELKAFFMKPDDDLKDFSGGLFTHDEFTKWYANLSEESSQGNFPIHIQVVVAPPQYLGKEYRCIMSKGKFITGSSYRMRSMKAVENIDFSLSKAPHVIEFTERMAKIWEPAEIYCMDVVETEEGDGQGLKILELNCFNASGWYDCNVDKIVDAVSRLFPHAGATVEETDVLEKIAALHKALCDLPNPHPDDYDEIREHTKQLRNLVMWRIANRADPVSFPGPLTMDEIHQQLWSFKDINVRPVR